MAEPCGDAVAYVSPHGRSAGEQRIEHRPGHEVGMRQVEPRGRGGQVKHVIAGRYAVQNPYCAALR
jgi:hypothetical protein